MLPNRTRRVSKRFIIAKGYAIAASVSEKPALLLVFNGWNYFELQTGAITFTHMQRPAAAFVARKELGIVVSIAIDTLPRKDRVIARRQAAQREASALIGGSLAIAIGMRAQPRFRHSHDHRIGDRLVFLIRSHALGARSI